jgi:hypothetical protein
LAATDLNRQTPTQPVMYFYSGLPTHFYSGVDRQPTPERFLAEFPPRSAEVARGGFTYPP